MYTVQIFRHKNGKGKIFLASNLECLVDYKVEEEIFGETNIEALQKAQEYIMQFNTPVIWVYYDVITPHFFLFSGYRGDMRKISVSGAIELQKELICESLEHAHKERERGAAELRKTDVFVS